MESRTFCSMVRKIYVYPNEEVKKLNTGHLKELTTGKKTSCAYNVAG